MILRGMTWQHDRGLAPMLATSAQFRELNPDVLIEWETRSLRDFGDAPVQRLAEQYDLVVLDHPFMGDLALAGEFLPLDQHLPPEQLQEYAADSVGLSHASYILEGHQWALAIDAAAQVMSFRSDLLEREGVSLPRTWEELFELTRIGRGFVSVALLPLDATMCFFSLCANAGDPCFQNGDRLVARQTGEYALDMLSRLLQTSSSTARSENPIALYERMSSTDQTACCPLAFGYSNYSRPGYRPRLIYFGGVPSAGLGSVGATLGGAGLAISARCAHRDVALAYASLVAERDCQRGLYTKAGGQPARRSAWVDDEANSLTSQYFRSTLPALEQAWLRPRYAGFVRHQNAAGEVIARYLNGTDSSTATLDEFDRLLREMPRE